jgi:site-specific recombinase XerC
MILTDTTNWRVRGKGRHERVLILWKSVADSIRAWLAVRDQTVTPETCRCSAERGFSMAQDFR